MELTLDILPNITSYPPDIDIEAIKVSNPSLRYLLPKVKCEYQLLQDSIRRFDIRIL
ncbi:hypothetical protein D3C87_948320 [compost metagenome]